MTGVFLTRDELLDLFRKNDWEVIDDYWEIKRIAFKRKDGQNFNIQYCDEYYHPIVARLCRDWEIEMPEKIKKPQEQYEEYLRRKKELEEQGQKEDDPPAGE